MYSKVKYLERYDEMTPLWEGCPPIVTWTRMEVLVLKGFLLETAMESHVITVFHAFESSSSSKWMTSMDKKSSLKFHVHEYVFGAHMSVQLAVCFNLSVPVEWDLTPESKR